MHMVGLQDKILEERPYFHTFDKEEALECIDPKHRPLYDKFVTFANFAIYRLMKGGVVWIQTK